MDGAVGDLAKITGQKPQVTKSRKAIAAFKLRDGVAVGCKVTLRGARMYEFLDRLINVAMPRIRDFRGVSARSFDGRGNYTIGVKEQIIFPEIDYDQIDAIRGHGYHDHDDGARRPRRAGVARSLQLPVPQVRTRLMAKTSMVKREKRRAKLVKKHAAQAREAQGDDPQPEVDATRSARKRSAEAAEAAARYAASRLRNRCAITGRSRGVYRKFGLGARQAARSDDARRHAGPAQGQLVSERYWRTHEHDGSHRRLPDPHPQRPAVGKPKCRCRRRKIKLALAKVLKDEGYIDDFRVDADGAQADAEDEPEVLQGRPVIERLERV